MNDGRMLPHARLARGVLAAGLLVAACSGDGGQSVAGTAADSTLQASVKASDSTDFAGDGVGARSALSMVRCGASDDGVWAGSGLLANSTSGELRYRVRFAVVDAQTFRVLGESEEFVSLPSGASEVIRFDDIHQGGVADGRCVQRVVVED